MKRMRVLVVEDDKVVGSLVEKILEKKNFDVDLVATGSLGEELATNGSYDCIVLDLGLPDIDGLEICRNLRDKQIDTPLLILSAYDAINIKVSGLDFGADDYLTKPFDNTELIARVEALIRRYHAGKSKEELVCGELKINLITRKFFVNNNEIELTNNEFDLMAYFLKNQDRVISINELAENVWEIGFDTRTNYVNVYLSYIRKKMRPYTSRKYFKTVRKQGFKISAD
jgi:DNA-binding response OmpR family regulator